MLSQQSRPEEPSDQRTDSVGPITLPKRSRIGARAYALVGTTGLFAAGAIQLIDNCPTWPTTTVSYY
jgi:hypothetical protein